LTVRRAQVDNMKRYLKKNVKSLLRSIFECIQKFGFNILPEHFYSQIPNISQLKGDDYWRAANTMIGVNGVELNLQIQFLNEVCEGTRYDDPHLYEKACNANGQGGGYGRIEASFLANFVAKFNPKKVIQIGCGVSTGIILEAAKGAGYQPEIVCVEPFPSVYLANLAANNLIKLVVQKAQLVPIELLTELDENDLFFVDSTHTVKPGSEVNRIILEILPRLKPKVWVHFHDIYFPYDYKRDLLTEDLFFWSESTLLHAYLINNKNIDVKLSQSLMHYQGAEHLKNHFLSYDPQSNVDGLRGESGRDFPSSIYLQTK
jgi:hypothetical protein